MTHEEALAVGREHVEAGNEWHAHWLELMAQIGSTRSDLDGEVVRALAFVEAKKSPLYERAVKAESAYGELRSGADHAISQSEVRWTETTERISKKLDELPKGENDAEQ